MADLGSAAGSLLGFVSPVLGAAAQIGGALIGGQDTMAAANLQGQQAQEAATSANQFSEQMSDTQWQRTVADMKAAGVNPALAYSQGPNTAPTGQQAVVPNYAGAAAQSSANTVGALGSISGIQQQAAQTAATSASELSTIADTAKTISELPNAASTRALQAASTKQAIAQALSSAADLKVKGAQIGLINRESDQVGVNMFGQQLQNQRDSNVLNAQTNMGDSYWTGSALAQLGGGAHSAAQAAVLLGNM